MTSAEDNLIGERIRKLKEIAPNIAFTVGWEEDKHHVWDYEGPDPREEGFIPYDVDVSANQ